MVYHGLNDKRLKTITFPFDDGSHPTYYIPVEASDIINDSDISGETVKDALNTLNTLRPNATPADIGKALVVIAVDPVTGKPSAYGYDVTGEEADTAMSDTSTNPVQNKVIKAYVDSMMAHGYSVVQVSGTDVEIAAQSDTMYVCGELASLDITSLPTSGVVIIIYESGTTATVLDIPSTVMMPEWFLSQPNQTVMIGITNGILGSVQSWD